MAVKSYAYAVGNVRAKENALFSRTDIEMLLACADDKAAAVFLRDKGYADAETPLDSALIIKSEEQKLWDYIKSVAPDFSVFEAFVLQNDCHNIKTVFKSHLSGTDAKDLLLFPATIEISTILKVCTEQDFSDLPDYLLGSVKDAYDALFKAHNPQRCDLILDATFMSRRLDTANKLSVPMLSTLIKTTVFYENIKAALRCAKAGKDADFCNMCLIDGTGVDKKTLVSAALRGTDEVLALLASKNEFAGHLAAEAYKTSAREFEKFADDTLMSVVLKAKYVAVGAEPLIAYLFAKLAEIKCVRMAVNAVRIGQDSAKTREMLRKMYE